MLLCAVPFAVVNPNLFLYCLGLCSLHCFCKFSKMFMCKHQSCILLVNCSSFNPHLLLVGMLLNSCGPVGSPVRESKGIICLLLREEENDFPTIRKAVTDVGNLWWLGRCPRPFCVTVSHECAMESHFCFPVTCMMHSH